MSHAYGVEALPGDSRPPCKSLRPCQRAFLNRIRVTISETAHGGASAERLLQQSDSAMYMAKRKPCRHVFFDYDGEGRRGQQDQLTDG